MSTTELLKLYKRIEELTNQLAIANEALRKADRKSDIDLAELSARHLRIQDQHDRHLRYRKENLSPE